MPMPDAPSPWPSTGGACREASDTGGEPVTSILPPGIAGRDDDDYLPPHDPDAARAALAAAGYPGGDGFPELSLATYGVGPAAAIAHEIERELGIEVQVEEWSFEDHGAILETETPAMWTMAWSADYPDAHDFLGLLLRSDSGANVGGWSDPAYDALIEAAASDLRPGRAGAPLRGGTGHPARRGPAHPPGLRQLVGAEPRGPRRQRRLGRGTRPLRRPGLALMSGPEATVPGLAQRARGAVHGQRPVAGAVAALTLAVATILGGQAVAQVPAGEASQPLAGGALVELAQPAAGGDFGQPVTFETTFRTALLPRRVELLTRVQGDETLHVSLADLERIGDDAWGASVVQGGHIVPNTTFEYAFRVVTDEGTVTGPTARHVVVDRRIAWQQLAGDDVTVWWHEGDRDFAAHALDIAEARGGLGLRAPRDSGP